MSACFYLIECVIVSVWFLRLNPDTTRDPLLNSLVEGGSISCSELAVGFRCSFENICMTRGTVIVFRGPRTRLEGVPYRPRRQGLVNLSGVPNHSAMLLDYVVGEWSPEWMELYASGRIHFIHENALLMRRFLPDNFMHAIHDDLLPLFWTRKEMNDKVEWTVFNDNYDIDIPFKDLYDTVAKNHFQISNDNEDEDEDIYCFKHATVGLSNRTLWYQYGFEQPQGPVISSNDSGWDFSLDIRQFVDFLLSELRIEGKEKENKAVILARKENRMILNEDELTTALASRLRLHVTVLNLETLSLRQLISEISSARILIGMHGSLLVGSMFLRSPSSIVLELFPYGVNPDNYTPYRTLVERLGFRYLAWRNTNPKATVSHPEYPKELGGIRHLPKDIQEKIERSQEVPLHLCCSDPEWLYRIYQDTVVNVDELISLLRTHL